MPAARQTRHGSALLSAIAWSAMCVTAQPLPVQADPPIVADPPQQAAGSGAAGSPRGAGDAAPAPPRSVESELRAGRAEQDEGQPRRVTGHEAPAAVGSQRALTEFVVRDRSFAMLLTSARAALDGGRTGEAITALQSVLDAPEDVFVWPQGAEAPASARQLAARELRRLPAAALAEYERRHGAEAQRLWREFERTLDSNVLRVLLQRFEMTAAGAQALRWTALTSLDHGEFAESARAFERWLSHPAWEGEGEADERFRVLASVAAELSSEAGITVAMPPADASRPLSIGRDTRTAGEWQRHLSESLRRRPQGDPASPGDWRLPLGDAEGHRACTGSVPTREPLWSVAHDDWTAEDREIVTVGYRSALQPHQLLGSWTAARLERRMPCAAACFPLVVAGQVVVRDFGGVSARDLRSGKERWRFACAAALNRRALELQAAGKAAATPDSSVAAAQLFDDLYAANSVLGMLSSDGERVYFVDAAPAEDSEPAEPRERQAWNRLMAVSLDVPGRSGGELVWQLGCGAGATDGGRYFLGPPLPAEGVLFAIAERDSLVSLLALEADSGAVRWEQPISLVDAAIADDPQRARQACSPVLAGGIVVCPTQLGTIVGVDARTGTLLWVYAYAESSGPSQPWRGARSFEREFGRPEYPNLPLLVQGLAIILAPQSAYVHCLELASGRCRWKQPREQAQYAAVAGGALLLVGLRDCVARRLEDGAELWRQPIDAPAGRGVAVGDTFLLACADGRIRSVDLRTGATAPDLLPPVERPRSLVVRAGEEGAIGADDGEHAAAPGNLILSGDFVVSCSPTGLTVYPQAQVVLHALRRNATSADRDAADWLQQGELELRLGEHDMARRSLWCALGADPGSGTRAVAERRLRDLYYAELERGADPAPAFAALETLCVEPEDRARFLALRLEHELRCDDAAAALRTMLAIERLALQRPVVMDGEGRYEVEPERRAACLLARYFRGDFGRVARQLEEGLTADRAGFAEGTGALQEQFNWSAAGRARRAERASALVAAGNFHEAELLLLRDCRHVHPDVRQAAQEQLAALRARCGLERPAGVVAWRNGEAPAREPVLEIARVEIEQEVCTEDCAREGAACACRVLDQLLTRTREIARRGNGARLLLDRGMQGAPERHSVLSVVDLREPRLVADLAPLPPRVWRSGDGSRYDAGHFVPIVAIDVHGVSLLEGRIVWTATPDRHRTGVKPLLGPYGPEFCILQSHETVTALDPRDGRVIWRRSDLPFDAGLASDDVTGMFADDSALVIFEADRVTYHVLDPRSGERLTSGVLEPAADPRRRGWSFGRRLLYVTQGPAARLRLWDPLAGRFTFDEPASGRCLIDGGAGSGLAVVLNGGRLLVLNTLTGEVEWEAEHPDAALSGVRQVRGVACGERLVIHLEQEVHNSPTSQVAEITLANLPAGGTLQVVERGTGREWSRSVPRCNLLLFPGASLPVLVTIGRGRESRTETAGTYVLEVIDAATGASLAVRDDLVRRSTRPLIHSRYDREDGLLELIGVGSRIRVRWIAAGERLP